jgi:phage repressor protein C with HTH and peptisase S24 domain
MRSASFETPPANSQARSNALIPGILNKMLVIRYQDSWGVNNKIPDIYSGMATPGQRIAQARERKGWTQTELATACGWKQSRIGNYEAGISAPKKRDYEIIADAIGLPDVTPSWLMFGATVAEDDAVSPYSVTTDRYAMIPLYSVEARAGGRGASEYEQIAKTLAYRRDWLEANRLSAALCVVVTVSGESMQPTIFHGDTVLVNTGDHKIQNGQVYAFRHDEGARIKRLFVQMDGKIRVVSDNPDKITYPDEFLTPDTDAGMIGRVVHRSGRV